MTQSHGHIVPWKQKKPSEDFERFPEGAELTFANKIKPIKIMKKSPNNRGGAPLFMIIFLLISTGLVERAHARDIKLPPQATVSGTVSDVDGLPLPGVHIQVESTKVGTISDLDGTFSIQAGAKDVLVFSIVGFKKLEVAIGGRQHLEVSLEQDVTQLEEVVLNAGYYTVSERERTGNISKVTAVEIERQPV